MQPRFLIWVVLFLVAGCKDYGSQPVAPDPYERWLSYSLHNYTIDQARICFCPGAGETMRITVRSDTIAFIVRVSDGSTVTPPTSTTFLTVNSLFGIIHNPGTDSLRVTYNKTYGYPESLDINPQLHPLDVGVLYATSNLQIP